MLVFLICVYTMCLVLDKDALLTKEMEHFNIVYNRMKSMKCEVDEKSYKVIPKFYFKVSNLKTCSMCIFCYFSPSFLHMGNGQLLLEYGVILQNASKIIVTVKSN